MNVAEYISSGILEQYINNSLSEQERKEVECMSHIYPEIKEELLGLQQALEEYATAFSKDPKPSIKERIFAEIDKMESEFPKPEINNVVEDGDELKVIQLKPKTIYYKIAIAASVLLCMSFGFMWYQNDRELKDANNKLSETIKIKSQLETTTHELALVNHPDFRKVVLRGVPEKDSKAYMMVYWNPSAKEVYVDVTNMPKTPSDKQYQLWALKDGVPVDMGVFDFNTKGLQKMKLLDNAQAFAVTLEKKGGVSSPTLSEMYVLGTI